MVIRRNGWKVWNVVSRLCKNWVWENEFNSW